MDVGPPLRFIDGNHGKEEMQSLLISLNCRLTLWAIEQYNTIIH